MSPTHPLRCHRPRIPDRVIFDKLIQVVVLGISYNKIADSSCSPTTLRSRRDEWIRLGIFSRLEAIARDGYETMVGLDLEHLLIDGYIVKAPCGGEAAGGSRWIEGNKAPNAPCSPMVQGSRWESWSPRRTDTTPHCYAPPWNVSAVSISV